MRGKDKKRMNLKSEINVTPFVDVMLVLLIIFMVTSPMLIAGVDVELPKAEAKAINSDDAPLTISVNKKKEIYLEETKISMDELFPRLEAIINHKKDVRIFIRGDAQVDYGLVLQIFAAIKNAGFNNVGLITDVSVDSGKGAASKKTKI